MRPLLFTNGDETYGDSQRRPPIVRVEAPVETPGGTFMMMMLDCDDTFDFVVQYPDGEREIVWSLVRDRASFEGGGLPDDIDEHLVDLEEEGEDGDEDD